MFEMWFLTVFGEIWSSPAIIALSLPLAISFSTSISRSESSARIVLSISGCVEDARTRWSDWANPEWIAFAARTFYDRAAAASP